MANASKRDLALIYAISFVDLFAVGLTFPLFSNYLRDLGASHFVVGLISSLYSGLQVLSGPFVGSWSDVRDRKSVMLITLLICSIGYALLGMAESLVIIAIIRGLLGVTKHTQSLSKAVITDLLPVKERAGAFGMSAALGSIGFIAGPFLGGHISEMHNGFFYACLITSFLFLINMALTVKMSNTYIKAKSENPQRQNNHHSASFTGKVKREFSNSIADITDINWGALWQSFLLRFLFGLSLTMYFSQQSVYLKEQFNMSQRHIGYTISYFSTVGTICAFLLGYLNRYLYRNDENCLRRLTHSFVLMSFCFIALYLAPNVEGFLVFLAPFAISCTMLRIVSMELVLKKSENTHRGSLSGSSNSIMSIARFITPVTSGVISDVFGNHSTMLFAGVPSLVGTCVCMFMQFKEQNLRVRLKAD